VFSHAFGYLVDMYASREPLLKTWFLSTLSPLGTKLDTTISESIASRECPLARRGFFVYGDAPNVTVETENGVEKPVERRSEPCG